MQSGYIAAGIFLLTAGGGSLAQVLKLRRRISAWKKGALEESEICAGLHPLREFWSFTAFSLFALSGLTRSYLDVFLVGSRAPAIVLSTITLGIMGMHGAAPAKRFSAIAMFIDAFSILLLACVVSGMTFGDSMLSRFIDYALVIVSMLLFYGKMTQAISMLKTRRTAAVSWLREIGLVLKDTSGMWYSLGVGSELLWISVTHILSWFASSFICFAKWRVENSDPRSPSQDVMGNA